MQIVILFFLVYIYHSAFFMLLLCIINIIILFYFFKVELLRIMETAENGDGSLSNSSVPNWNNKTNHNKNFENNASTSQSNGSGNISLTSAMANGMMLQTNSPGMNSFAKSKPDATTFNSVTMDSTMYSVPFSQLVNTVSMVPQTSWKSGSEVDTLKSPSSLSKSESMCGDQLITLHYRNKWVESVWQVQLVTLHYRNKWVESMWQDHKCVSQQNL